MAYCLDFTATGKINDDALVFALAWTTDRLIHDCLSLRSVLWWRSFNATGVGGSPAHMPRANKPYTDRLQVVRDGIVLQSAHKPRTSAPRAQLQTAGARANHFE